jgi:hypothetical protein
VNIVVQLECRMAMVVQKNYANVAVAYDRAVLKANQSTSLLNFPDMVHNLDVEPKRKKQKVRSNNKSGYKGVHKRASGRFAACIYKNGKTAGIGTFDTAIAAAHAYDQAAIKNGNKSHTLNFPNGLPIDDSEESSSSSSSSSSTTPPPPPAAVPPPAEEEIIGLRVGPRPDDESEWL